MTIIARGPGFVACSFTDAEVKWERPGRRPVYFEFSEMFGPIFTDRTGRVLEKQPQPGSTKWAAFDEWHRERARVRASASGGV